jgi:hypothetical protein
MPISWVFILPEWALYEPSFCLYYDCFSPQGDCVEVYEGYPLDKYRSGPLLSLEMGSSNEMNSTRIRTVLAGFFFSIQ